MEEVILVCDQLCLSKTSLLSRLDAIQAEYPQFTYRTADPLESRELLKVYKTSITPFLIINQQPFYQVSSKENILNALSIL